ncbi:hypothetical protein [Rhodococcoides fascians]|uniref:hypothetical protein n=1 Tax=Rhodococcoides fascians TaxID=1828 RepID=UPI000AC0619B|nr:hypothetical protein [Rhodococcus fascians]
MTPRQGNTVSGYTYQWSLFADWCAAADVESLPATPITVAKFLDENPAGQTVQLRRVSAINRIHLDAGHPAPGRATSLRLALDSPREARTIRLAVQYQTIAARLPTVGSTAALFGRRDAVLLLLAGAGLSHSAIASLDRDEIKIDSESISIGGHHCVRIDAYDIADFSPAKVWERWHTILQFSERYPSTTLLAEHLQDNTFPMMWGWPTRSGPIAIPIDRWGHMPLPVTAMSAAEIGSVIALHRTGNAPLHSSRGHRTVSVHNQEDTEQSQIFGPTELERSVELDSGYYRSGVDARHRAHTALADVPNLVDDVEDRIEMLLQRTLDLLGSEAS